MATESNSLDDDSEYGKECPTCGRDDFKNRIGMLNHHAKTHGESLVRLTGDLECPSCDMSGFENNHGLGNHHAQVHGEPLDLHKKTITCDICGKEFDREKCKIGENNFCSSDCRASWIRESGILRGENHPNHSPKTDIECETCGEVFEVKPSYGHRARFCSVDCYGSWRSKNMQGEDNPRYTGYVESYRPGFTFRLKEEIRERDESQCVCCGMSQDEHLEICDKRLHVHHIQPYHTFDNPRDAHFDSNLITLCYQCHSKWDQIPGLRPQTA